MARLDYTDIKAGTFFSANGVVYECVESTFSKKSRQKGSNQVRIKNLATGAVTAKTLHAADQFEDVDIAKATFIFVYRRGSEAVVHPEGSPGERTSIDTSSIQGIDLIPDGTPLTGLVSDGTILTVRPPITVEVRVKEAPPNIRGNTSQGGSKHVVVETGATVSTPLFIETGDTITVKTATGEYVERTSKA